MNTYGQYVFRYGYVCSITFGIAHCVQLNGTAISSDFGNSSIPFASLSMTCITDESALNYLITASAVVSLSESIFRAIVPAVSGDQVRKKRCAIER